MEKNVAANAATLEHAGCHVPVCRILDFENFAYGRPGTVPAEGQSYPAQGWDLILVSDCTYPPELPGTTGVYEKEEESAWRPLMRTLLHLCRDSIARKRRDACQTENTPAFKSEAVEVLVAHTTRCEGDVARL